MQKFKAEIVKTYRRYVEMEAQDEDATYQEIDANINRVKLICLVMEKLSV